MLKNDPVKDRYCDFSYNPNTGEYGRNWIQYSDGTFEPVRRVGSLSKKYEAERTNYNWWHVRKPAAWRPWNEGFGFSWNHGLGEDAKPDDWGTKSNRERRAGDTPYFLKIDLNDDHRIASRTEKINGRRETWEFLYDEAGRLTGCESDTTWVQNYHYDDKGRRSEDCELGREPFGRKYEYTDDNRLLAAGDVRFEHDENGFRSARADEAGTTRYRYDDEYRLQGATMADGREIVFEHEDGRRTAKYINGRLEEEYEWLDFIRLGRFKDEVNDWKFLYDGTERVPYAAMVNGTEYTFHYDQVGSLKTVVSPTGNVVKTIQYDPFGNILWDANPTLRVPIGFAGGLYDPDTGFVRFGWRDYDPDTGRWTAQDPIGDLGGDPDWYGYCLDDPVNMIDPLGLWGYGGHEDHDGQNASDPANSNDTAGRQSDSQAAENNGPGNANGVGNESDKGSWLDNLKDWAKQFDYRSPKKRALDARRKSTYDRWYEQNFGSMNRRREAERQRERMQTMHEERRQAKQKTIDRYNDYMDAQKEKALERQQALSSVGPAYKQNKLGTSNTAPASPAQTPMGELTVDDLGDFPEIAEKYAQGKKKREMANKKAGPVDPGLQKEIERKRAARDKETKKSLDKFQKAMDQKAQVSLNVDLKDIWSSPLEGMKPFSFKDLNPVNEDVSNEEALNGDNNEALLEKTKTARTVQVANRSLLGMASLLEGLSPVGPLGDLLNIEGIHQGFVFDNGFVLGFGPDGWFDDSENIDQYTPYDGTTFDAGHMAKTIRQTPTGNYWGVGNNCQSVTDKVLDNYDNIDRYKKH